MNMPNMNPLLRLHAIGQRIWLDNLSRTLLREGELQKLITEDRIAGVTSNPTIFYKAISESPYYRDELQALKADSSLSAEQRYETLAVADIRSACDLLQPLYKSSNGDDGYVSLEVSPVLVDAVWHRRNQQRSSHVWLREVVQRAANSAFQQTPSA